MSRALRKTKPWKTDRSAAEELTYPSGMVWCPMKMSGMAIMRCAELQKEFGCGSVRHFRLVANTNVAHGSFSWPWLRRHRDCPERASEKEIRELRLALSPLRSADKSTKNPRAYRCPACGGRKAFGARQCRRCWRLSTTR